MVKRKLYATLVRPTMMYGSECWAVKKEHVHRLEVEESYMLRRMMGVKWQDKLENEYVRVRAGVEGIGQKLRQSRLRWFGHVHRMADTELVKRVRVMQVQGKPRHRGDQSRHGILW